MTLRGVHVLLAVGVALGVGGYWYTQSTWVAHVNQDTAQTAHLTDTLVGLPDNALLPVSPDRSSIEAVTEDLRLGAAAASVSMGAVQATQTGPTQWTLTGAATGTPDSVLTFTGALAAAGELTLDTASTEQGPDGQWAVAFTVLVTPGGSDGR